MSVEQHLPPIDLGAYGLNVYYRAAGESYQRQYGAQYLPVVQGPAEAMEKVLPALREALPQHFESADLNPEGISFVPFVNMDQSLDDIVHALVRVMPEGRVGAPAPEVVDRTAPSPSWGLDGVVAYLRRSTREDAPEGYDRRLVFLGDRARIEALEDAIIRAAEDEDQPLPSHLAEKFVLVENAVEGDAGRVSLIGRPPLEPEAVGAIFDTLLPNHLAPTEYVAPEVVAQRDPAPALLSADEPDDLEIGPAAPEPEGGEVLGDPGTPEPEPEPEPEQEQTPADLARAFFDKDDEALYGPIREVIARSLIHRVDSDEPAKRITQNRWSDGVKRVVGGEHAGLGADYWDPAYGFSWRRAQEYTEAGLNDAARHYVEQHRDEPEVLADKLERLQAIQPNLTIKSSTSVTRQQFSTPVAMAYLAGRGTLADLDSRVWEPTAGMGALTMLADTAKVEGYEIDPTRVALAQQSMPGVREGDAVASGAPEPRAYDVMAANPPFGAFQDGGPKIRAVAGLHEDVELRTPRVDFYIAAKHLEAMKNDGTAVIIIGGRNHLAEPGSYSEQHEHFFNFLYDQYNVVGHAEVDGSLYSTQGAGYPVHMIHVAGRYPDLMEVDAPERLPVIRDFSALREHVEQVRERANAEVKVIRQQWAERDEPQAEEPEQPVAEPESQPEGEAPEGGGTTLGDGPAIPDETPADEQPQSEEVSAEPGDAQPGEQDAQEAPEDAPEVSGLATDDLLADQPVYDPFMPDVSERIVVMADEIMDRVRQAGERDESEQDERENGRAGEGPAFGGEETDEDRSQGKGNVSPETEEDEGNLAYDDEGREYLGPDSEVEVGDALLDTDGVRYVVKSVAPTYVGVAMVNDELEETHDSFTVLRTNGDPSITSPYHPHSKPMVLEGTTLRALRESQRALDGGFVPADSTAERDQASEQQGEEAAKRREEAAEEGVVPYVPRSQMNSLEKVIPQNLEAGVQQALDALEAEYGQIDDFVCQQMNWTKEELGERLAAEQVDAVALSMRNMLKGKGMIIGDATGIGKGRTAATLVAWQAKQGERVLFTTAKANLFGDMLARDLEDIGERDVVKPLILNDGVKITDEETKKVLVQSSSRREVNSLIRNRTLGDYNVIFATYSQFNRTHEKCQRAQWLGAVANQLHLVMDEAHEAGGDSNQGANMLTAVREACSVAYLSGTYAKRPDSMKIFERTDMMEGQDPDSVISAVREGGMTFIEGMSTMLSKVAYVYRDHGAPPEMGIEWVGTQDDESRQRVRDWGDHMARIYDLFTQLSDETGGAVNERNREISKQVKQIKKEAGEKAASKYSGWRAHSTHFISRMGLTDTQFRYALKSDEIADALIEQVQAGYRPVVVVDNTMEAFLRQRMNVEMDLQGLSGSNAGETDQVTAVDSLKAGHLSFRDTLLTWLPKLVSYSETDRYGNKKSNPIVDIEAERLLPKHEQSAAAKLYFMAEKTVMELPDDLPASPIDWIEHRLAQEDIKLAEITNREVRIDYSHPDGPQFALRSAQDRKDRYRMVDRFNNGDHQVALINRSGNTGLSLHASEKFRNQEPRMMNVLQPDPDINGFMQALGRVRRTGSVNEPGFKLVLTELPSEKRPAAVLMGKLAKLMASTRSDREGSLDLDAPDMLNTVGDNVALDFLWNNPGFARRMRMDPEDYSQNPEDRQGLMRRLTGRLLLLSVSEQEQAYRQLEDMFDSRVAALEAEGISPFKTPVMDLRARVESSKEILPREDDGTNPFKDGVRLDTLAYEVELRPVPAQEVKDWISTGHQLLRERKLPTTPWEKIGERVNAVFDKRIEEALGSKRWEGKTLQDALNDDKTNAVKELTAKKQRMAKAASLMRPGRLVRNISPSLDTKVDEALVVAVRPPKNVDDYHKPGDWKIQMVSPESEVGTFQVSLAHLMGELEAVEKAERFTGGQFSISAEGSPYGVLDPVESAELYGEERGEEIFARLRDRMFRDDRPSGKQTVRRQVLSGHPFKAFEMKEQIGAGHMGRYTDAQGVRHMAVIMPRGADVAEQISELSYPLADDEAIDAYIRYREECFENPAGSLDASDTTLFSFGSTRSGPVCEVSMGALGHGDYRVTTSPAKTQAGFIFTNEQVQKILGGEFEGSPGGRGRMSMRVEDRGRVVRFLKWMSENSRYTPRTRAVKSDSEWYTNYRKERVNQRMPEDHAPGEKGEDEPKDENEQRMRRAASTPVPSP